MRLDSLNLIAFGRFEGKTLDFDRLQQDFHLVYGTNEAGKTTALEAVRCLLYGIPNRTGYSFLHPHAKLQVGGRLSIGGKSYHFVRRSGRLNTVRDEAGKPLEEGFLRQATAAMQQDQFEKMFALTHEDLVAGGKEITQGGGDVGEALFGAGLGGVQLNSLLRQTRDELDELFGPRSSKPLLNAKFKQLGELDGALRQLQVSGDQWVRKDRELRQTKKRLEGLTTDVEELTGEQNRLKRIQRTLPLLEKLEKLTAELAELGEVVTLPEDFEASHRDALQSEKQALHNLDSLKGKQQEAQQKAEKLTVPEDLLQRAVEVEQLLERLGSYQKAETDKDTLKDRLREGGNQIAELLGRLPGKPDLKTALESMPDDGLVARVQDLMTRKEALERSLRQAETESENCRKTLAEARALLDRLPPERDTTELQRACRELRNQGDLERDLRNRQSALTQEEQAAQTRLVQLGLWQGNLEDLPTLRVPLRATVQEAAELSRTSQNELQRLQERCQDLETEEEEVARQLKGLALAGSVPLESDLTNARRERDEGWQLIKRRYLHGEEPDLTEYAPEGDVGTVYEGQVQGADELADRLRREAQRVEQRALLESKLQTTREHLAKVREQLRRQIAQIEEGEELWKQQWAEAGIGPLRPTEMLEWLTSLEGLRTAAEQVLRRRQEVGETREAVEKARAKLGRQLEVLSEPPAAEQEALAQLLQRAEALLEEAGVVRTDRQRLTRELAQGKGDLERRDRALAEARRDLEQWQTDWKSATERLSLGEQPEVPQVRAILQVLSDLRTRDGDARSLDQRIQDIERDATRFRQDVQGLVAALAPDLVELKPADATRELQRRLAQAREDQTRLDGLNRQLRDYKVDEAREAERLQEARQKLADLAALAQCEVSGLETAWGRHCKHRDLQRDLKQTRESLAQLGDGLDEEKLSAEAEGRDRDQIVAQLQTLAEELTGATERREQDKKDLWEQERELRAIDGNATAAAKAEERQLLVAKIRDEAERYLTLAVARQLLSQAIETYRAQNQGDLLPRAGQIFAHITKGSFADLRPEYGDNEKPFLVGVRAGSKEVVKVEGMSDGTCDQLYLALRLAALEQSARDSEPRPLIVDDLLIRFDDDRARATLEVLGEFSRQNQVIFFTHHRRLQQLAEGVLGKEGYQLHDLSA